MTMAKPDFTDDELSAYLDEQLPSERAAEVETALRETDSLRTRVASLIRRRDQGSHSVGEIWRRNRLSCPNRVVLGNYVLGILEPEETEYLDFHIQTVGCRFCAANLADLEASRAADDPQPRRKRFFESSAGHLRNADED
jgi:anti-sigma factor RsiW